MDTMLENLDVTNVEDRCALLPKKLFKVIIDVNHKFLEIWIVKMPWEKPNFNEDGFIYVI